MRYVSLLSASVWLCSCGTEVAYDLYSQERILEVEVQMSPADFAELRVQTRDPLALLRGDCLAQPFPEAFSYFPADVVVNGQTVEDVGIRKKGFLGSLSESKPGLKIDFAEFVPSQELFGRKKLTLNNAVADPSLLRQCMTYDLFNKAGIPAPQCGFAHVTVNGEDMGIYVNVETASLKGITHIMMATYTKGR
jgi:spore coat protein H